MMKIAFAAITALVVGLTGTGFAADKGVPKHDAAGRHMVAQAMLTAHFVAAALKAGMGRGEINSVLTSIAEHSVISEFWVSDSEGRIVFTNLPEVDFSFPTHTGAATQAAPFAALLDGSKRVVVQKARPRELDNEIYRYVGVAGVDRSRIVQVGINGKDLKEN